MSLLHHHVSVNLICGVLGHLYFNRFEPRSPLVHFVLLVAVPAALAWRQYSFLTALIPTYALYLGALLLSLTVYRLNPFHPLAKYPGPVICRVTKLPMAIHAYRGTHHLYTQEQHRKYGTAVRIGPNALSFTDAALIHDMMGSQGLPKGTFWHGQSPGMAGTSLINMFDAAEHSRRRKVWNRAFKADALKDYGPIIAARTEQLLNALELVKGPTDMCQWLDYWSFDFMTDMVFGGGSDMMRNGDADGIWETLKAPRPMRGFGGQMPWLAPYMLMYILTLPGTIMRFRTLVIDSCMKRLDAGAHNKDLMFHLSDEGGFQATKPTTQEVLSDGALAIVAGSDTTSTTLSNIFFFLATHRECYLRLQREIDTIYTTTVGNPDISQFAHLPYLNAVINESLRLIPVTLSGSPREPHRGKHGDAMVGSHSILEGTSVQMQFWTMLRDARNFSPAPDSFIPDRWLEPDARSPSCPKITAHNTTAFIPFSHGPAVCVGKNLALIEMRTVIASLMSRFDFRLADDFMPHDYLDSIRDFFVTERGPLSMILTARKQSTPLHE